MPEELKPCPNPECDYPTAIYPCRNRERNQHWMGCQNCGMIGPICADVSEAARLWNLLPRVDEAAVRRGFEALDSARRLAQTLG